MRFHNKKNKSGAPVRSGFNRRSLVNALCGIVLTPHLVCAQARADAGASSLSAALRTLGESLRLPHSTKLLGQRFRTLRAHRHEANLLLAELERTPHASTAQSVAQRYAELRSNDFRANRIVIIDGWVLARAEAELCELLAA